jgi:hypothetical protein
MSAIDEATSRDAALVPPLSGAAQSSRCLRGVVAVKWIAVVSAIADEVLRLGLDHDIVDVLNRRYRHGLA